MVAAVPSDKEKPEGNGEGSAYHRKGSTLFAKGNPGKPKGARVKHGARIGDMVARALDGAGGVDYLIECARDPKTRGSFLSLVAKLMPAVRDLGPGAQASFAALVEASYKGLPRPEIVDLEPVDSDDDENPGHLPNPGRPA